MFDSWNEGPSNDYLIRSIPKLLYLGIGGNFYKVVKYIYSNSKCAVKMDTWMSKLGYYNKGVRQGDGLSLLLCNNYINDVDQIILY